MPDDSIPFVSLVGYNVLPLLTDVSSESIRKKFVQNLSPRDVIQPQFVNARSGRQVVPPELCSNRIPDIIPFNGALNFVASATSLALAALKQVLSVASTSVYAVCYRFNLCIFFFFVFIYPCG